ncbi:MAG: universal stress protein [Thermoanaerobaculia bacterium]|jgi:nucleotide-binding universal stress UspA family protein
MDPVSERPAADSRLRSVVSAIDFSAPSDVALSWAMTIARTHKAQLHLVHAVSRTLPLLSRHEVLSPLAEASIGEADSRLAELADSIRSPDQPVHHHLLHDRPSVSILKVADWERAGLIVIGTRGEGGVDRLMMGSTTERVAAGASCPVLSVAPGSKPGSALPSRILIATDFSIEADAAAISAQEIFRAQERKVSILLLAVLHTPTGMARDLEVSRLWREYVSECRALLQERLAVLSSTFGLEDASARVLLREGIPATEIARVANQEEADVIAMGGRGSFAAGQEFLGSVAKRVIQTASCPVLTVPSLLSRRMRNLI